MLVVTGRTDPIASIVPLVAGGAVDANGNIVASPSSDSLGGGSGGGDVASGVLDIVVENLLDPLDFQVPVEGRLMSCNAWYWHEICLALYYHFLFFFHSLLRTPLPHP